jgi:hypothetical protein
MFYIILYGAGWPTEPTCMYPCRNDNPCHPLRKKLRRVLQVSGYAGTINTECICPQTTSHAAREISLPSYSSPRTSRSSTLEPPLFYKRVNPSSTFLNSSLD